jgi:SanA protein
MRRKKLLYLLSLSILALFILITVLVCNAAIRKAAAGKLYSDASAIPYHKTGLLLGTNKYLKNGNVNDYYRYRIEAAAALLRAGKIKYLIISGDNSRPDYNEPQLMKDDLIKLGVDSTALYLDFAGFRTYDSIIRLKEIFGQDDVTIISQQFHNERAIYLAEKEGISAIGFNARDVSKYNGFLTQVREKLARVKVFIDLQFHPKPKFLGERINLP